MHYRLLRSSYKRRSKQAKAILWSGVFIMPLIALMIVFYKIYFIDWLLGEHASNYHGYTLLIVIFGYPLVLPFYLIIMKLADVYLKRVFLTS